LFSARTISQVIAENSEVAIHLIDMRRRGAVCRRGCLERRKRPRGREGGRAVGQVMVRAEGLMRAKVQQMAGLDVMMGEFTARLIHHVVQPLRSILESVPVHPHVSACLRAFMCLHLYGFVGVRMVCECAREECQRLAVMLTPRPGF
jgi:hypothetical protein